MQELNCGFVELDNVEVLTIDAGGWKLAIVGGIGGCLTGAVAGAGITIGCPAVGAVIGGIGGLCTGAIAGWKK